MTCLEWTILLLAVAQVESGGDLWAVNHREKAYGSMQVRPAVVQDVNRHYKTTYRHGATLGSPQQGQDLFILYGRMYGAKTPEQFCRIWVGGPDGNRQKGTARYWFKVQRTIQELEMQSLYANAD